MNITFWWAMKFVPILIFGAVIVAIGWPGKAETPLQHPWTSDTLMTVKPSSGCAIATVSQDERDVSVDWKCIDEAIARTDNPGGATLRYFAIILKAVKDGKAK